EGDSDDRTFEVVQERLQQACSGFRGKVLVKQDFGFAMPAVVPRFSPVYQAQRRAILARARNHLLFHVLSDEDWVLWLDADIIEYPPSIIEQLTSLDRDIVQPNCVCEYGQTMFDLNAWTDGGRKPLSDLCGQ